MTPNELPNRAPARAEPTSPAIAAKRARADAWFDQMIAEAAARGIVVRR